MECKKCGVDLAGKEYRDVAQWSFCLECFHALMEKAEGQKGDGKKAPVPDAVRERTTCLVCEEEIVQDDRREMLGLVFCRECYENLVRRPDIPPRREREDTETGVGPSDKPAVAQVRVDLNTPVECHGCGRLIPAVASKKINDDLYCPDCYYTLPEIQAEQPQPFPAVIMGQPDVTEMEHENAADEETGRRCQACQRQALPDTLRILEGFEICVACLTTDPNTALDIARTRHRRALERMKRELDG